MMRSFGAQLRVKTHVCVGGTKVRDEQRALMEEGDAQVVVGTPGRVRKMLLSRALSRGKHTIFWKK